MNPKAIEVIIFLGLSESINALRALSMTKGSAAFVAPWTMLLYRRVWVCWGFSLKILAQVLRKLIVYMLDGLEEDPEKSSEITPVCQRELTERWRWW